MRRSLRGTQNSGERSHRASQRAWGERVIVDAMCMPACATMT
jgi:hypothetical protein